MRHDDHSEKEYEDPDSDAGRRAQKGGCLLCGCICMIVLAIVLRHLCVGYLDNDFFHIAVSGRWIAEHGIMYRNPFFVLDGYDTLIQQWVYAVGLWHSYDLGGFPGVFIFTLLQAVLLYFFVFRFLRLRNVERRLAWIGAALFLLGVPELNCRPEMISLILFLAEMILLEQYLKCSKAGYLYLLPFLSIAQANLHAAYLPFCFVLLLPYLVPADRIPILKDGAKKLGICCESIPLRSMIFPAVLMLLGGLVNPYGAEAYLIIPYSGSIRLLNIIEQQPMNIFGRGIAQIVIGLLLLGVLLACRRLRSVSAYYFAGFLLISLIAEKNVMLFMLALIMLYADLAENVDGGPVWEVFTIPSATGRYLLLGLSLAASVAMIIVGGACRVGRDPEDGYFLNAPLQCDLSDCERYPDVAIRYILQEESSPEQIKVLSTFNDGSTFLFYGIGHVFIEPKTEPYIKKINHRSDVISEYCWLMQAADTEGICDFLNKYDFDYIVCTPAMRGLETYLQMSGDYCCVLESEATQDTYLDTVGVSFPEYRLYRKNNMVRNNLW
ncbi:MAG: hypothetical protein J6N53_00610 [Lachnospiraceae bacterium]|nr:hypothetical protein [Lachnospiraceae bacterium]